MIKIQPLGDRIVIKPLARGEVTRGGIVLPDSAKEKPLEGRVVAVGPGRLTDDGKRVPMEVKEGQVVMFAKYSGTEIKIDDQDEYIILNEKEVLAILPDKE